MDSQYTCHKYCIIRELPCFYNSALLTLYPPYLPWDHQLPDLASKIRIWLSAMLHNAVIYIIFAIYSIYLPVKPYCDTTCYFRFNEFQAKIHEFFDFSKKSMKIRSKKTTTYYKNPQLDKGGAVRSPL